MFKELEMKIQLFHKNQLGLAKVIGKVNKTKLNN